MKKGFITAFVLAATFSLSSAFIACSTTKDASESWNEDISHATDLPSSDITSDITSDNTSDNTNKEEGEGTRRVDFTLGSVQNVSGLSDYSLNCPTTGKPAVLVIPVEFSDVTAAKKGYTIENIQKAFNGVEGDTDYYSVHDYYYQSSYGKLDLQITVVNEWFKPSKTSSYYAKYYETVEGEEYFMGDQVIMDEALAYLDKKMDLSAFDTDENGCIDAVVLVNTLEIDSDKEFQWAYRYWNYYVDDEDLYYEYDGVSANDYLWASYQFLFEDSYGTFEDETAMNTYTFIHEFGHILGADDYYDYNASGYQSTPLDGYDVMDGMSGDHNAFTKFHYGWLTSARLVTAESVTTLELEKFSKNGDSLLVASNWDDKKGLYQEYYLIVYYTNDGLNGSVYGYFENEGILVYHVNAELVTEYYDGEGWTSLKNTNTSVSNKWDSYDGTKDNLIEFVKGSNQNYVYGVGDSLSKTIKDDAGKKIAYTFTVDKLENGKATLTFTKNA